ncbi:hypothetical protein TRIP_C60029 [Candidatus Zixiibacteriota bacterium]|nr:hypothetical protein TRIP_C60029 [candidate division Zixibacteria bacterium]
MIEVFNLQNVICGLHEITMANRNIPAYTSDESRDKYIRSVIDHTKKVFSQFGFNIESNLMLIDNMSKTRQSGEQIAKEFERLFWQIEHELKSLQCYFVDRFAVATYNGLSLSDTVIDKFPTAYYHFIHSRKCYLLGEFAASMYHAMRADGEILPIVGKRLEIHGITTNINLRGNWGNVISQLKEKIASLSKSASRDSKLKKEKDELSSVLEHMFTIKEAWRNHIMHDLNEVADADALKTINSTKIL